MQPKKKSHSGDISVAPGVKFFQNGVAVAFFRQFNVTAPPFLFYPIN
jgi:hypothetical protein